MLKNFIAILSLFILIICFQIFNVFFHEVGHWFFAKLFWVNGSIEVIFNFSEVLSFEWISWLYKFDRNSNLELLNSWQLILIYAGGMIFELLLLISIWIYFFKKKRESFVFTSLFVFASLSFLLSFNENLIKDDERKLASDGQNIRQILKETDFLTKN